MWANQRYINVVTAKEMFHCQLLVWSQLAVSEGFGGITYLADSNFKVSHGSVSQVLITFFITRDINNSAI